MKKLLFSLFYTCIQIFVFAQTITAYNKQEVMIPMRDGIKLYTVILTPKEKTGPLPILIQRTPYGAEVPYNYDILANTYVGTLL